MLIIENIMLALNGLRSNKMRTFLTMLGIIIGICAVITIMTLGQSVTNKFSKRQTRMKTGTRRHRA